MKMLTILFYIQGLVLSKYLAKQPSSFWQNKRILEVGSGTGLVGIAVGSLGASLTITDLEPQVNLIKENIELNKHLLNDTKAEILAW